MDQEEQTQTPPSAQGDGDPGENASEQTEGADGQEPGDADPPTDTPSE